MSTTMVDTPKPRTLKVTKAADGLPRVKGVATDKHPDPIATIEVVTPEMAEAWLAQDSYNRPIMESLFQRYTRDVAMARWLLSGDAIRFDWDGVLIDGQHRLWAAVESKCAFRTFVIRGLDPAVFVILDSGSKRSVGDVLGIQKKVNGKLKAAVARYIFFYKTGGEAEALARGKVRGGKSGPTTQEVLAAFARYEEAIDESISRAKALKDADQLLPLGLAAFLHFACAEKNRQLANRFFGDLSAEQADRGSPTFLLIRRLREWRRRRIHQSRLLGDATIRVWNAVRENRPLGKLSLLTRFDAKTGTPKIL